MEPASALLERIRSERAGKVENPQKRKADKVVQGWIKAGQIELF